MLLTKKSAMFNSLKKSKIKLIFLKKSSLKKIVLRAKNHY